MIIVEYEKKITHSRYINSFNEMFSKFWQMFSHFQKANSNRKDLLNLCVNYY